MTLQNILSTMRKACEEYSMISDGDKIAVGLSGGKDSTIAAALCVEALGADRVIGVLMPNGIQHDIDARCLCYQ